MRSSAFVASIVETWGEKDSHGARVKGFWEQRNGNTTVGFTPHWEQKKPGHVSIYEFPEALGVPHDMIDPNQPDAKSKSHIPKSLKRAN